MSAVEPEDPGPTAAESLEGIELPGPWLVVERIERGPGHTGGTFSVSYRVERADGQPAFVKVLDYELALQFPDTAVALQAMTRAYLFEVEVLAMCGDKRLSRVVRALDSGETFVEIEGRRERVSYLVFELADGDVRDAIDAADRIDDAWKLRMLHHTATGIRQLHSNGVAHQDLKPSNVLVFNGDSSKVADLGCASVRGTQSPRDPLPVPGDRTYAPPELLYGQVALEWNDRRLASDLYHLGSVAVFLFAGQGVTSLLLDRLAREHHFDEWGDSYEDVLPFIRVAFDEVMEEFTDVCPEPVREELVTRVRELCEPDPSLRGHPINRARPGSQYSLERYVAAFDKLTRQAEIRLRGELR
jgi:serine/threonine protein kinase